MTKFNWKKYIESRHESEKQMNIKNNDLLKKRNSFSQASNLINKNKEENVDVSILFFGLTRSLKYTINFIKKNIFEPLTKENISWNGFTHTYDQKKINNPRSGEKNVKINVQKDLNLLPKNFKIKKTNPEQFLKNINLNNYLKHGDPWQDKQASMKNLILQLNSLKEVTKMADPKKNKAKVYIFLRPDLAYLDPTPTKIIKKCIKNFKKPIVYTPDWQKWRGLNDRFVIATKSTALIYGNRFALAKKYAAKNELHSETFLGSLLKKYNKNGLEVRAVRVRANGKFAKNDLESFNLLK